MEIETKLEEIKVKRQRGLEINVETASELPTEAGLQSQPCKRQ